jgi:hypothetical protein
LFISLLILIKDHRSFNVGLKGDKNQVVDFFNYFYFIFMMVSIFFGPHAVSHLGFRDFYFLWTKIMKVLMIMLFLKKITDLPGKLWLFVGEKVYKNLLRVSTKKCMRRILVSLFFWSRLLFLTFKVILLISWPIYLTPYGSNSGWIVWSPPDVDIESVLTHLQSTSPMTLALRCQVKSPVLCRCFVHEDLNIVM